MRDNYLPNPAQNSRGLMTKHKNDISEVGVTRGTIILSDMGQCAKPTSEQNRSLLHSYINLYTSNFQLGLISA